MDYKRDVVSLNPGQSRVVNFRLFSPGSFETIVCQLMSRASDFFQDWWANVTHGAKYGRSFPKHIKLTRVDIWVVYFTYTLTQALVCIHVY